MKREAHALIMTTLGLFHRTAPLIVLPISVLHTVLVKNSGWVYCMFYTATSRWNELDFLL